MIHILGSKCDDVVICGYNAWKIASVFGGL